MSATASLFSRFLTSLGVPHTSSYSDAEFRRMTFKSLFGLSHLLKDYGIPNEAYRLHDKQEMLELAPPFLAQQRSGAFAIVEQTGKDAGCVVYDLKGDLRTSSASEFLKDCNGIVLLAYPESGSGEPGYASHAVRQVVERLSGYLLMAFAIAVAAYFFIERGVWRSPSMILALVFDCVGLWLSFMLLQKSLGIHTAASEKVCGVLERGGCDAIAASSASKLFGVFSWSEVGFGYFGVSLATLLLFPHLWPALAACNILCLPYTVWSVTYQKFVARHWCTLCVGVQAVLWCLFFCYLFGGETARIFPLHLDLFVLMGVYVAAVLSLNALLRILKNIPCNEKNSAL